MDSEATDQTRHLSERARVINPGYPIPDRIALGLAYAAGDPRGISFLDVSIGRAAGGSMAGQIVAFTPQLVHLVDLGTAEVMTLSRSSLAWLRVEDIDRLVCKYDGLQEPIPLPRGVRPEPVKPLYESLLRDLANRR